VDGADEVAPDKGLIKGRGAAMVGEKLLAEACDAFLVIVDSGKLVDRLGLKFPVPVEILPAALLLAQRGIAALGGQPTLRQAAGKDGPVVTDNGNLILDVVFRPLGSEAVPGSQGAASDPAVPDWKALDAALDSIPGVVGHGLFLRYAPKSTVLVGASGGVRTLS
jgi:ribose 5-phosphate isomerase A